MGWMYREKPDDIKEWFREQTDFENEWVRKRLLDSAIVNFRTWYGALEITDKESGERKVVALVSLLDFRSKEERHNFGVKDMDETMGPNERQCPERILKRLTPLPDAPKEGSDPYEHERQWREDC